MAGQSWTIVAAIAYLASTIIFLSYGSLTIRSPFLLLGTALLAGGYGTLGVLKALDAKAKREGELQNVKQAAATDARFYKLGYAFMIAFYGLCFLLPIAFHTQIYDLLACIGYALLFVGIKTIGFITVFIYYAWASMHKFHDLTHTSHHDFVRTFVLALARAALAAYYVGMLII
jgi:hypothetical protein